MSTATKIYMRSISNMVVIFYKPPLIVFSFPQKSKIQKEMWFDWFEIYTPRQINSKQKKVIIK